MNASYEKETNTVTDGRGMYTVELPAGQYQVTAVDTCDLNAGFAIAGRAQDDVMITVPGTSEVNCRVLDHAGSRHSGRLLEVRTPGTIDRWPIVRI